MGFFKCLRNIYLSFTWFSMVAMNGEEGDKRFNQIYNKDKN